MGLIVLLLLIVLLVGGLPAWPTAPAGATTRRAASAWFC